MNHCVHGPATSAHLRRASGSTVLASRSFCWTIPPLAAARYLSLQMVGTVGTPVASITIPLRSYKGVRPALVRLLRNVVSLPKYFSYDSIASQPSSRLTEEAKPDGLHETPRVSRQAWVEYREKRSHATQLEVFGSNDKLKDSTGRQLRSGSSIQNLSRYSENSSVVSDLSYVYEDDEAEAGTIQPRLLDQDVNSLLPELAMDDALMEYDEAELDRSKFSTEGGEEWLRTDEKPWPSTVPSQWAGKEDRLSFLETMEKPERIDRGEVKTDSYRMKELLSRLLSEGHTTRDIAHQWRIGERQLSIRAMMLYLLETRHEFLAYRIFEAAFTPAVYSGEYIKQRRTALNPNASTDVYLTEVAFSHFYSKMLDAYSAINNLSSEKEKMVLERAFQTWSRKLVHLHGLINQTAFTVHLEPVQYKFLTKVLPPTLSKVLHQQVHKFVDLPEPCLLSFIKPLALQGNFAEAFDILQKVQRTPKRRLYDESRTLAFKDLMYLLYKAGVPIHTSSLLEMFLLFKDHVDTRIYHAFLFAAVKANDVETATTLFNDFENVTKSKPNILTYTCMFNLFKRIRDRDGMRNTNLQAVQAGLDPHQDLAFVNSVLHAECFGERNTYPLVYARYREFFHDAPLKACGLPIPRGFEYINGPRVGGPMEPDHITLAIMIYAFYSHVGRIHVWGHYQRYLECCAASNPPLAFAVANEHILATFILALGRSKTGLNMAVHITKQMTSPEYSYLPNPTLISFNSLMRSFANHGDVVRCQQVLGIILKRGLKPNTWTYNCMMSANTLVERDREAGIWLARMLKEGWIGDDFTRSIIEDSRHQSRLVAGFRAERERLNDVDGKRAKVGPIDVLMRDAEENHDPNPDNNHEPRDIGGWGEFAAGG